ncbi:MAG TPA: hypothetical protein VNN76_04770 [Bacteroidota bacterium]|nr:hypothetical protein [Bacteroidota bacterium]
MVAISALIALGFLSPSLEAQPDSLFVEEFSFGSFRDAVRLTISPQHWIYVADAGDHTIHLYQDPNSTPTTIGGYGWQIGSFDSPKGIVTDGINVFVADFGNHRVQRFDRRLSHISSLSTRDTAIAEARFGYPVDVALSRFGDLFVLDGENLRIVKFQVSGRFERSFGDIEQGSRRLRRPLALKLAPRDRVVVFEAGRAVEFDYFGNFLRVIGEGLLNNARALGVSEEGFVVATDSLMMFFSAEGALQQRIPFGSLFVDEPVRDVRDIWVDRQRLYLLTKTKCIVLVKR